MQNGQTLVCKQMLKKHDDYSLKRRKHSRNIINLLKKKRKE